MKRFSENLIDRTIRYFRDRYELEISPDEAEEYLDSLANLYLITHSIIKDEEGFFD